MSSENLIPRGYVMYAPTFRCNYRCKFCFLDFDRLINKEKEQIHLDRIADIFYKSRVLKGLPVLLSGGEPFVRGNLPWFIAKMNETGYHIDVTTNGSFPDKVDKAYQLTRTPEKFSINISVDGIENTHDELRGIKGAFAKCVQTIKVAKRATCAKVQVNSVLLNENIHQIQRLRELLSEFGVLHMPIPLVSKDGRFSPNYSESQLIKLVPYLYHPLFIDYVLHKNLIQGENCHAGSTSVFIDPYGDVYPCEVIGMSGFKGKEKFVMGNAVEKDFDQIWFSDKADYIRRNVIPTCKGCFTFCNAFREYTLHGLKTKYSTDELCKYIELPSIIDVTDEKNNIFLPNGWYLPEAGHRHTMQNFQVFMKDDASKILLELSNMHPFRGNQAKVKINGSYAGTFTIPPSSGFKIYSIECEGGNKNLDISFELEHTWQPSRVIGNNDNRELGLTFRRIWSEDKEKIILNDFYKASLDCGSKKHQKRVHAVWFITMRCHQKCPYCWVRERDNPLSDYPLQEASKWIDAWNKIDGKYLIDITGGEPFLQPGLIDIINSLDEKTIAITTNLEHDVTHFAQEISPEKCTSITASLHPSGKMQVEYFLGKVLFLKNRGFHVVVNFVAYPEQIWLIPEYKSLFESIGVPFHVDPYLQLGKKKFTFNDNELTFLKKYVRADRNEQLEKADVQYVCTAGVDHLVVLPNGDAYTCFTKRRKKENYLGNILDGSFKLRDSLITCRVNYCGGCDIDHVVRRKT